MADSFLEILEESFLKLVEKSVITMDELKKGIHIAPTWFYSSKIDRQVFFSAIANRLKQNNPDYEGGCRFKGTDPEKFAEILLKYRDEEGIQLTILGNDYWSKLVITDFPNNRFALPQITPSQLIEYINNAFVENKRQELIRRGISEEKASDIIDVLYDERILRVIREDHALGLTEMADGLADYYEYLLGEEKEARYIHAEYRERPQDIGTPKGPKVNVKIPKKNPNISFKDRCAVLDRNKPTRVILFERGKGEKREISDAAYLYEGKDGDFFMVCEPYQGNESSRVIYLSKETIQESLGEGEKADNEFWRKRADLYVNMTTAEFRGQRFGYTAYHTDTDSYLESLQLIVDHLREKKIPKIDSGSTRAVGRAERVCRKLLNGYQYPSIKETAIKNVKDQKPTPELLEALRAKFGAVKTTSYQQGIIGKGERPGKEAPKR